MPRATVPRATVVWLVAALGCLWLAGAASLAEGAELHAGAATADITPEEPVALTGYRTVRISQGVRSRAEANVLALEGRENGERVGEAILVSADLCVIRPGIQQRFREFVAERLPDFDVDHLFLAATHTHTAPVLLQDRYQDYGDAMEPKEYVPFLFERMAEAVVEAWKQREPGSVAWGLGHAAVGYNRRAVYADGHAKMYGDTERPDFRRVEGYQDAGMHVLCLYDGDRQLKAAVLAPAAPSQATGGRQLSADFWAPARRGIEERYGEGVTVLGFCAPAGDQASRPLFRRGPEQRMAKLRGLTWTEELGRRIADAFAEVEPVIRQNIRDDPPFAHRVERFEIPEHPVSEKRHADYRKKLDRLAAKDEMVGPDWWNRHFYELIVRRYERQQKGDDGHPVEMHVLRIGDLAIATNPFELYLDYGVRIQARSPAPQTMPIQLASPIGFEYYLPTRRALEAGGYSAEQTFVVGPEGGRVLVDRTVATIGRVWEAAAE